MLVVADGAVVARLLWFDSGHLLGLNSVTSCCKPRFGIVAIDVTLEAPSHVQRRMLFDLRHVLDGTVAALAGDTRVYVAHMRKAHVFREFVDSDPGDRTPFIWLTYGSILLQFADLFARSRGLSIDCRTIGTNDEVATHASAYRRKSWVRRLVGAVVTVEAVQPEGLYVDRVRKCDGLNGRETLRRRRAAISGEQGGRNCNCEERWKERPLTPARHQSLGVR